MKIWRRVAWWYAGPPPKRLCRGSNMFHSVGELFRGFSLYSHFEAPYLRVKGHGGAPCWIRTVAKSWRHVPLYHCKTPPERRGGRGRGSASAGGSTSGGEAREIRIYFAMGRSHFLHFHSKRYENKEVIETHMGFVLKKSVTLVLTIRCRIISYTILLPIR